MNVSTVLHHGANRAGSGPAWVYCDQQRSYPQLVDRVSRLAGGLRCAGLVPGDRVVLNLPNSPELLEVLCACLWGGFVAVPLNWHLHAEEVADIARDCGASAIVVAAETSVAGEALAPSTRVFHTTGPGVSRLSSLAEAEPLPMRDVAADNPGWLFYTSGTTGAPKGAVLTHRNLWSMTLNYYADVDAVAPRSVFLHAAPLTHGSGLYLLPALGRGAVNVIAPPATFDPDAYLDLVAAHGVTHLAFLAPTMLNRVVAAAEPDDARLRSVRSCVVGGAPLYAHDALAARRRLGPVITQIYGQGEAPMTISVLAPNEIGGPRTDSCGRPFAGVEVRIVDEGGAGVGPGRTGEVTVRGDVVMSGYWANPPATAAALSHGWLRTGDIGHLDQGYLYLTDRAKDVVITGGSNVYPREVEEVLVAHPGVHEVAVVGEPDAEWGESLAAFVVATPGCAVTGGQLVDHCRAHLASFKKPRRVVFVEELPRNATGKILKHELRRRRVAQDAAPDAAHAARVLEATS